MIVLIFSISLFFLTLAYVFYWGYGFYKGAPFYPSKKKFRAALLEELKQIKNPVIAELGSGDGRIAIDMARQGYRVSAFEINPFLTLISKLFAKLHRAKSLEILNQDFLKQDLSKYNVIVTYLYPGIMQKIAAKLEKEAKPGTLVISNTFRIKSREPIKEKDKMLVYKFG